MDKIFECLGMHNYKAFSILESFENNTFPIWRVDEVKVCKWCGKVKQTNLVFMYVSVPSREERAAIVRGLKEKRGLQ